MKRFSFTLILLFLAAQVFAQGKAPANWYLSNPADSKVYGVGAEEAYKLLTGKTSKEVIVAVIDSGVETDHPDLKDVIWVNKNEIPDNGIDDDKNGYVDDIHGWSFLGGQVGDIKDEASELSRMCREDQKYFEGKDIKNLSGQDSIRNKNYQERKVIFDAEKMNSARQYQGVLALSGYMDAVKLESNGIFSKATNKSYKPKNDMEKKMQSRMKLIFTMIKPEDLDKEIVSAKEMFAGQIKMNNMDADSMRRAIVGDNPSDLTERYYGCNRYEGPDAMHGTHVSGIIAATRGNGIGIEGIAANTKIMVIRTVPNGDERDIDIANAIMYAADNGAKVINMSFGKYYTPNKDIIDKAVKYAESKDVLLVHAAGNDAKNKDVQDSYPTRIFNDGAIAPNWLEVGASSSAKDSKKLIADFSNYGATTVDLFAPGVDIYSTVPDGKYEDASGTSMACPAAAGVAALIRSYFPELTAAEVKNALMRNTIPYSKSIIVPGTKKKGTMKDLCISGGFINAATTVADLLK